MSKEIEIGRNIKLAREQKRLSQMEVVKKLANENVNISRETLSKIENGNRKISAVELIALCEILNIDINNVFSGEAPQDLVTLFRKQKFSGNTIKEIKELQEMIKMFIHQKKICNLYDRRSDN